MNVLVYCRKSRYGNWPGGGAEVSLQLIAERLARLGDTVCFATECVPGVKHFQKKRVNGVDVYSLEPIHRWVKAVTPLRLYKRSMDLRRRKFLAHIVKTEGIKLIYAFDTLRDLPNLLKAREEYRLDVRIVLRVAGLFHIACIENGRTTRSLIEWVFNSVDAVNYLTWAFRDLAVATAQKHGLRLAPKREFVQDIGISLDSFPYRWLPQRTQPFRIVSVARFSLYQKRQDVLIDSLRHLHHIDVTVDFLGTGRTLEDSRERCSRAGLSDRVTFHGFCDHERLRQLLQVADLFALPTDYEGLPKAMIEAMAVGTPCLVSDVPPLNSYVLDGVTGYLARNTPEEWAAKLLVIMREPHRSAEISRQARKVVEQHHSAADCIVAYRQQFATLLHLANTGSGAVSPND